MTLFPKLPPGFLRDLKLALEILRGRRHLPGDNPRFWAALQLPPAADRLEHGVYEPAAQTPTLEEARS